MDISLTKKELASAAGYSYRQVYNIDKGLPEGRKLFVEGEGGKYDLAVFIQRWVDYRTAKSEEDVSDLETIKAQHEAVKKQKTELEVERMRGQLVDVQDVRRLWGEIAKNIMQNAMHLESKLAPRLVMVESQEEVSAAIDAEVRAMLEGIADTPLPDYAAGPEEEEEAEE